MKRQIQACHVERRAFVYVRQSTVAQVRGNGESTSRQYALAERAVTLGWPETNVEVIDQDLGKSGATTQGRSGLQRMAQAVAQGRAGAIFALEVSRLARSSTDWQQLLRLCAVAEVLVVDEEKVYDPRDPDDRLLLDFKGTMSEMELSWLGLRLAGARQNKARRGELQIPLPTGYVWGSQGPAMDPDESVRKAISVLFDRFETATSAIALVRWARRTGYELPKRSFRSSQSGALSEVVWKPLSVSRLCSILHNPTYAGVYAYGRVTTREVIRDGEIEKVCQRNALDDWQVRLPDSHAGYITWEAYVNNQRKLDANRALEGAPREGSALLSGLLICGRCGGRMITTYWTRKDESAAKFTYSCNGDKLNGGRPCWGVAGLSIDGAVERLFLEKSAPDELELTLAVQERIHRQGEELTQGWQLRIERAEYESRLAERRYKSVDPDNRVVARSLERDWELKLQDVERLRTQLEDVRRQKGVALSEADRARIRGLAANLPAVWRANTTAMADRKAMLRLVVEAVVLEPRDAPRRETAIRIQWKSGCVSELEVPRPTRREWSATPPDAVDRIAQWAAEGIRDEVIAERLNEAGIVTGKGKTWNVIAVRWARQRSGIEQMAPDAPRRFPLPDRGPDGRYSVAGAARKLGVGENVVRGWIERGLVEAHREEYEQYKGVWWLSIDEATEARLRTPRGPIAPRRAPLPDRHVDGRYSIPGAARRFDVSTSTINVWIGREEVVARQEDFGGYRGVWLLEIDEKTAAQLDELAARTRRKKRSMAKN